MTHRNDTSWPPLVREPSEVDYDEDEELVCVDCAIGHPHAGERSLVHRLSHARARSELLITNMTKSRITIHTIHATTVKRPSQYQLPGLPPMNP